MDAETRRVAFAELVPASLRERFSYERRLPVWRARLEEQTAEARAWVALRHDVVVGYVYAGPSRDPDADPARTGEIYDLYVVAEHWRGGLGRMLMSAAVEALRSTGRCRVTLWVIDGNARARRFYESRGFAADGARRTAPSGVEEIRYGADVGQPSEAV